MKQLIHALALISSVALPAGAQVVIGSLAPAGPGTARVWYIDVASGDRTQLLDVEVTALAVDDAGGRLLFCGFDNRLYQANYGSTAAPVHICTLQTATGGLPAIGGLAFLGGKLYVSANSSLVTVSEVNLNTGVLTQTAAPTWVAGKALAADASTGKLYSYVEFPLSGHAPGIYELDPNNMANPVQVAPIANVYPDIDGLAVGGGRAYLIGDSYFDFPVFEFATNSYLANTLVSPFGNDSFLAGGEFAPSLAAPSGARFFCRRKASSQQCQSVTMTSGVPSVSAGSGFLLSAHLLAPRRAAMWNYSLAGRANLPFAGGTMCIAAPVRRTQGQRTHGNNNCTGNVQYDFGEYLGSGADPALVVGTMVQAQLFVRDPGFAAPDNLALSDGIEFTIQP